VIVIVEEGTAKTAQGGVKLRLLQAAINKH
jgi:hypothetical protein